MGQCRAESCRVTRNGEVWPFPPVLETGEHWFESSFLDQFMSRDKQRDAKRYRFFRHVTSAIKLFFGCKVCGYCKNANALEFHHRDPKTKTRGVARLSHVGLKKLLEEISKCDVLCANCHAEHHT